MADRAQTHAGRGKIESVRQFFEGRAGGVDATNAHGQNSMHAILPAAVGLEWDILHWKLKLVCGKER
jgi:hypothetical protein